jgi:anti-sigma regulatory factor (Ser/Thr protein kinase)
MSGRCSLAIIEIATLLTSELVTNAVLHAAPPVLLRARITEAVIRVEVHDSGTSMLPAPRKSRAADLTGRGLTIIEALAYRWGVDPTSDGKCVWFELSTDEHMLR